MFHAEVRIDDSVVMLSDGEGRAPIAAHVHVYVADADKRGGVGGPGGTQWWFATQVE